MEPLLWKAALSGFLTQSLTATDRPSTHCYPLIRKALLIDDEDVRASGDVHDSNLILSGLETQLLCFAFQRDR